MSGSVELPRAAGRPIWPVVALFAAIALLGLLRHEMWRDELEIWLLARDSPTLPALLANMGTEGHPALWYLLNFGLARLTRDPRAMQLLSLVIGCGVVAVFLRHAPFSLAQRLLFCFGYYALYEFTVISRSYGLQLLLTFAFCARFVRRGRLDAAGTALLFLLANTTLFGTILAAHIVLWLLLERWLARRSAPMVFDRRFLGAAGVALGGVGLAFSHTLAQALAIGPAHAGAYRTPYGLRWLLEALSTPTYGFFPLPDPSTFHTWNSNLLDILPDPAGYAVGALFGIALLAGCALSLRGRPALMATFLLGVATMLAVTLFVWYGSTRHHGQPFLWFLTCCWLAAARLPGGAAEPSAVRGVLPAPDFAAGRARRAQVTAVLAVQLVAGSWAYARDLVVPFSMARATGQHLSRPEFAEATIVGSVDYAVEPIAAYLERPIYYPESRRFGSFLDWSERRRLLRPERVLEIAGELLREEGREIVLVLSYDLPGLELGQSARLGSGARLRYFARFTGALVRDENYHLHRVDDDDPGEAPGPVDSPPHGNDNGRR